MEKEKNAPTMNANYGSLWTQNLHTTDATVSSLEHMAYQDVAGRLYKINLFLKVSSKLSGMSDA